MNVYLYIKNFNLQNHNLAAIFEFFSLRKPVTETKHEQLDTELSNDCKGPFSEAWRSIF